MGVVIKMEGNPPGIFRSEHAQHVAQEELYILERGVGKLNSEPKGVSFATMKPPTSLLPETITERVDEKKKGCID